MPVAASWAADDARTRLTCSFPSRSRHGPATPSVVFLRAFVAVVCHLPQSNPHHPSCVEMEPKGAGLLPCKGDDEMIWRGIRQKACGGGGGMSATNPAAVRRMLAWTSGCTTRRQWQWHPIMNTQGGAKQAFPAGAAHTHASSVPAAPTHLLLVQAKPTCRRTIHMPCRHTQHARTHMQTEPRPQGGLAPVQLVARPCSRRRQQPTTTRGAMAPCPYMERAHTQTPPLHGCA